METTKPELTWIGGSCYRVNDVRDDAGEQKQQPSNEYVEEDLFGSEDGEHDNPEYEINQIQPGRFETVFHVPCTLFGLIIGKKGAVKKRIESETRATLKIPRTDADNKLTIIGMSHKSVSDARQRVEMIVLNGRHRGQMTHFTCVKMTIPSILEKFVDFKGKVLNIGASTLLDEDMFTKPNRLHVTLNVMYLLDEDDRSRAIHLLDECKATIIPRIIASDGKVLAKIAGLDIMNDDPSSVKVLYAKVESESLQKIGDAIYQHFIKSGFSKPQYGRNTVKLHMTLINTKDSKADDNDEINSHRREYKKIDARSILDQFHDQYFGTVEINEIHMAILKTEDEDGFYKCSTSIQL